MDYNSNLVSFHKIRNGILSVYQNAETPVNHASIIIHIYNYTYIYMYVVYKNNIISFVFLSDSMLNILTSS